MQDLHEVITEPSMARLSRAERRRQTARDIANAQHKQPVAAVETHDDEYADVVATFAQPEAPRTVRTTRRVLRVPEHVDYSGEYRMISHDLRRIAVWGTLLIVVMFAIRYSGLV
ncbi:MAG: hypothetical protein RL076_1010 [Chloroflexota bacterium]|jgi:hypothetical protein